jgi:heme-degrading monooxygenase HmoA
MLEMIQVIWEFVVKDEARGQFELAYGPGGAWSNLFAHSAGFQGTILLRDVRNQRRYLTIDLWESEAQRDHVLTKNKAAYAELDRAFAEWTESETEVGVFRVLAEGTVRPQRKRKRSKSRETRRGGRSGRE